MYNKAKQGLIPPPPPLNNGYHAYPVTKVRLYNVLITRSWVKKAPQLNSNYQAYEGLVPSHPPPK